MSIDILRVHAFKDNYLWVGADQNSKQAFVVDPGDASPVIACLKDADLELAVILVTHHHPDHTGGIAELVARYNCAVYGPDSPQIPQVTKALRENDRFEILGCHFVVYEVPGHTLDHIAYYSPHLSTAPALFCGDTLFVGGCGRLFEGSAEQMLASLDKLAALPADTLIYCAHEYTLSNLRFAAAVEPDNATLVAKLHEVGRKREQNLATVPSTLETELATNPFLRSRVASVREAARQRLGYSPRNDAETFATIRQWKDVF